MELSNTVILLVLALSPFIYVPLIISKEKRQYNSYIWIVITFLFGIVQCIGYLIILFLVGIKL